MEQLRLLQNSRVKKYKMRKFTLEQYKTMAERFNKMSFRDKIITIRDNRDILT